MALTANLCIDHQRRLDARPQPAEDAEETLASLAAEHDPIAATEARVDAERLLARPPAEDRMIVLMRLLLELEFGQIAEIMGIGLSAAKVRYARAIERLKAVA